MQSVIAAIVTLVIVAPLTWVFATLYHKKVSAAKIGNAEDKVREIIDEALKTAETKKRESLLEVKEESIRTKNELDKEIKERRAEAQRYERRVQQKEENIDKKSDAIEKKEASLVAREEELAKQREEISKLNEQRLQELERISGLTSEQAKEYLLKIVEDEVKHESAVMIKEMENRAKEEADKKAKEYVVNAIQKCAADHVSETTISVVQLPNDEMKGRIIGREGRNIRTLETMTGVDLIIDDTPEAVVLSGFDPIRREVARIALEKLIVDGRIHPARIEEMVEKAQKEVEVMIKEIAKSEGEDIERVLVKAIKAANREIIKEASGDEHLKGMGTTVVAATVKEQMLYFANVGDSRLYLINQGIQQLSKDHSLVEEMVRLGGIKPEEAKHHPDKNIITRAIGAKADVDVDFYEHRLKRGDIILMCTDGLSNMVEDEELFHIVQGSRDIVEAGEMLVEAAKENGGTDNIGVVLFEPFADEVSI